MQHVLSGYKTKQIFSALFGRCQRSIQGKKEGIVTRTNQYMNATRYGKSLYMLDQVRTTTCSRKQRVVGNRGRVLIYVRMNVNYDETVSKGSLWEAILPFWPRSSSQVSQQSQHGTVFSPQVVKMDILAFFLIRE